VGLSSLAASGGIYVHAASVKNESYSPQKRWYAQAALARRLQAQQEKPFSA
jgi:hypothetical protein